MRRSGKTKGEEECFSPPTPTLDPDHHLPAPYSLRDSLEYKYYPSVTYVRHKTRAFSSVLRSSVARRWPAESSESMTVNLDLRSYLFSAIVAATMVIFQASGQSMCGRVRRVPYFVRRFLFRLTAVAPAARATTAVK